MHKELESAIADVPILDVHTHLVGGKLAARGLHDILLYHMVVSDLYAAGCPAGARLTQFPGWPSEAEAQARIEQALPYLAHIQNTSSSWGLRIILRDLYDWSAPIDRSNWKKLDGLIRAHASGWTLERIAPLERSILRVGLSELLYGAELPGEHTIPPEGAIDEAVETAKRFCGADAPAFVNGILGVVLREQEAKQRQ